MPTFQFENLEFHEEVEKIKVIFLKIFSFYLEREDLAKIGKYKIKKNSIEFEADAEKKFYHLLDAGFRGLTNNLTKKKAIYIHRNSGIPLIGNNSFGIVDRGTNIIEIKPITGCNLNCIYCSVDEDRREVDFVVEEEYILQELRKLVEHKQDSSIEAHIGTQGEPLLYADLDKLISDISRIPQVKVISMDTNGTMLTRQRVDELVRAGLTQFNLSINAVDKKLAEKMAGCSYDINRVLELADYISKSKVKLLIAPVLVPKFNEEEMGKLVEFAVKLNARIGIQNFLDYRFGKNPAKPWDWDTFYDFLKKLEKKYDTKLILDEKDFHIHPTKELPKPFRKGEIVKASVMCHGRMRNEKIAAAKERTISVPNCTKEGNIRVKITRTKHNIFIGSLN